MAIAKKSAVPDPYDLGKATNTAYNKYLDAANKVSAKYLYPSNVSPKAITSVNLMYVGQLVLLCEVEFWSDRNFYDGALSGRTWGDMGTPVHGLWLVTSVGPKSMRAKRVVKSAYSITSPQELADLEKVEEEYSFRDAKGRGWVEVGNYVAIRDAVLADKRLPRIEALHADWAAKSKISDAAWRRDERAADARRSRREAKVEALNEALGCEVFETDWNDDLESRYPAEIVLPLAEAREALGWLTPAQARMVRKLVA